MCSKLSVQPQKVQWALALLGRRANEMLGPWESYKKPNWKHVQSYPVFLPGMYMLFLALFLKKNSLELGKIQRNAIKTIKGSKGWWWERTHATVGKNKKVEILQSVEMEVETSCVYERRLHRRSLLNLSITRSRREPYQLGSLEQGISFLGDQVSYFVIHIPKCPQQHTCPARCLLGKRYSLAKYIWESPHTVTSSRSFTICIH